MSRNLGRLEVREADPGSNPASGFGAVYLGSESVAPGTIYKRSSGGVLIPVGFGNPMTTAGDIIVGGTSGVPTRTAKGSNSRVFGVDAAGTLGYRQLVAGDVPSGLITQTMMANLPTVRLAYYQAANVYINQLANAGTFDLISAQSFTVGSGSSVCQLSTYGEVYVVNNSASADFRIELMLDSSAAFWYIASLYVPVSAGANSLNWAATVPMALSAGTHSLTVRIAVGVASSTLYFDCANTNLRKGAIHVAEYYN